MKIAQGEQVSVDELKAITGIEDGDIYYSILEQPLYIENKIHPVTIEMITKDDTGRLLGAVRGKDNAGNQVFQNVYYDTETKVWKINQTMNDMIQTLHDPEES